VPDSKVVPARPSRPDIDFGAIFAEFDTLLMGRRSYEALAGYGGAGAYPGMKVVVASRTRKASQHPKVTVVGEVAEAVPALRQEAGKDVWLWGGGDLFRSLLDLGLVDAVEVAVLPVLLGGGIPFLPSAQARTRLTLSGHRVYPKTGTVLLKYDVPKGSPKARRRKAAG
jgi:dihydrofolate reductase